MLPPTVRSTSPSSRTCSNTCSRIWWIGQTIPTLTADNYLIYPLPHLEEEQRPAGVGARVHGEGLPVELPRGKLLQVDIISRELRHLRT